MKCRWNYLIVTVIFLSCVGAWAQSGGMEGGGGKTVVCRNRNGSIRSVETLDLYEGRTVYQLRYQEASANYIDQAWNIFLGYPLGDDSVHHRSGSSGQGGPCVGFCSIDTWIDNTLRNLTFLPAGEKLKPIDDSLEAIIPAGCSLEQAVNYQNDQLILVDSLIWQAMSNTQKAALVVHESMYRYLRQYGEVDSRRARHYTAFLTSGHKPDTEKYVVGQKTLLCLGGTPGHYTDFDTILIPGEKGTASSKVAFNFGMLDGHIFMGWKYAEVELGERASTFWDEMEKPKGVVNGLSFILNSTFEPGDRIGIDFIQNKAVPGEYKIALSAVSAIDGSSINSVSVSCH